MKLVIVILNYKTTRLAIECLRSLASQRLPELLTQVVLVDNASGDDAPITLAKAIADNDWGSWVELLANSRNLGFTGGNNRAIQPWIERPDAPEYFLLLNSDTVVLPGAIKALIDFMDTHPQAGIASSQLRAEGGEEILASAFRFPGVWSELEMALRFGPVSKLLTGWRVVMPLPPQACRANWVPGASMILRTRMLREVGLLDEGYFTYFEDLDLCWRANRRGWEVWYAPDSHVVHLEGAASGMTRTSRKPRPSYWYEARRRFYLSQYGCWHAAAVDASWIVGTIVWRLRRWIQRKPDTDPPNLIADTVANSVFVKGFRIPYVRPPV